MGTATILLLSAEHGGLMCETEVAVLSI